jgi:hypothetical protein
MARRLVALVVLASLLALSPTAVAAPPCTAEQPDAPAYVVVSGATFVVYTETNGIAGLQTASCLDADGLSHPADTRFASGPPPIPQDLCVTIPIVNTRICLI